MLQFHTNFKQKKIDFFFPTIKKRRESDEECSQRIFRQIDRISLTFRRRCHNFLFRSVGYFFLKKFNENSKNVIYHLEHFARLFKIFQKNLNIFFKIQKNPQKSPNSTADRIKIFFTYRNKNSLWTPQNVNNKKKKRSRKFEKFRGASNGTTCAERLAHLPLPVAHLYSACVASRWKYFWCQATSRRGQKRKSWKAENDTEKKKKKVKPEVEHQAPVGCSSMESESFSGRQRASFFFFFKFGKLKNIFKFWKI